MSHNTIQIPMTFPLTLGDNNNNFVIYHNEPCNAIVLNQMSNTLTSYFIIRLLTFPLG